MTGGEHERVLFASGERLPELHLQTMDSRRSTRAMKAIIAYKVIKGGVMVLFALASTLALIAGQGAHLHAFALSLHENVTSRFAIETSDLLLRFATPGRLALTTLAVGLDGIVTSIEAWLLHRGTRWAILLVVCASSALIPWEIYELIRAFSIPRLALLLANVLVVIYLGWQSSKHVAHRQAERLPV